MSTAYDALGHEQDEPDDVTDDLLDAQRLLVAASRYFEIERLPWSSNSDMRREKEEHLGEALATFASRLTDLIDARVEKIVAARITPAIHAHHREAHRA